MPSAVIAPIQLLALELFAMLTLPFVYKNIGISDFPPPFEVILTLPLTYTKSLPLQLLSLFKLFLVNLKSLSTKILTLPFGQILILLPLIMGSVLFY